MRVALACLAVLLTTAVPPAAARTAMSDEPLVAPPVQWRASVAVGAPWAGRLVRGVKVPAEGAEWFTWDPVYDQQPNRPWRRWGTYELVQTVLEVAHDFRTDFPWAPRVGIGDLSRPYGGHFGRRFGGLGHASHQNGLDVDVWYPRVDARERRPLHPWQVDEFLAQELVDRFVAAGAEKVFVGPNLELDGPPGVVTPLVYHDDHLHVRLPD